ncbi:hypothetical protein A7K93_06125 [Candidatus Methylacidiphilum fumarolicum]|uniref:DUF4013 domain-containing protein n=2 Tax=Candidatus Methylacidiphilum fumarolicum TaxID=591154 RepID=I0K0K1_METFB|nr:hypothetical protein [Candidatus Methylacidiphilum fumarolicum]MBW6415534.1 hypothetical protein [Candidatus Methylacidiphilum fumarolicum]TFE68138.1 hypothetical protein A7K73_08025 [Candidatus Methylacidiphilum fumarolicum]TFE73448.1 hypothetical protein A7K93_06125 [Candidatus Methylacidiphilum fumarolicum]TFE74385.1 hypothetical protein A7K72_04375 [Candidatus Methylacidiphilum fumarolicum]TFE76944.1 hypothetical protein A7D33_07570 [Candidatus Methylacidiphilum fumarolicum]
MHEEAFQTSDTPEIEKSTFFLDIKKGFSQIFSDPWWWLKVLIGGILLINPFLLALIPKISSSHSAEKLPSTFLGLLIINVCTFWFPLGFTFEVLRRAKTGKLNQLPEWKLSLLWNYAREGAAKLTIALTTLILPAILWIGIVYYIFIQLLELPSSLLSLFIPPILWFVIPFCAVACCRWLDGVNVFDCALNFPENFRIFALSKTDYLIASAFLLGINSLTMAFYYTIPFGAFLGLCLVDTWFGPIYTKTVKKHKSSLYTLDSTQR